MQNMVWIHFIHYMYCTKETNELATRTNHSLPNLPAISWMQIMTQFVGDFVLPFPFSSIFSVGPNYFLSSCPHSRIFTFEPLGRSKKSAFPSHILTGVKARGEYKKTLGIYSFLPVCVIFPLAPFTPWRFRLSDDLFENTSFAVETSLKWSENAIRSCITIHRRVLLC